MPLYMSDAPPALPPLLQDRSFWALNATQFLGAFNDNLFKELVLLLCVEYSRTHHVQDYQSLATALFSVPFILFSGLAGYLSDRYPKPTGIVACKVAEVAIVVCGMAALATGQLWGPLAVLFLMGAHSAFFGPAKYGILPEMLRASDLPRANGIMLMVTFLAIIFGLSAAGGAIHFGNKWWGGQLWLTSIPCLVVAVTGVITALQIRRLPAAEPSLRFHSSSWFMTRETFWLIWNNRELRGVLTVSSLFWFVGGVVYPQATNAFGKLQLGMDDLLTGALAACTGVGIAAGCVVAGALSKDRIRGWVVRAGGFGLAASLAALSIPGPERGHTLLGTWGSAAALMSVGFFAGFFSVPLQVYLQAKAPHSQKGRIVAAMNLVNWIGIAGSGLVYGACAALIDRFHLPHATTFGICAVMMLAIAGIFVPPDCAVEVDLLETSTIG
jgi:MFS family permease